jgi:hypothetical protein
MYTSTDLPSKVKSSTYITTKEGSSPLFIRNRTKMSGTALLSELGLGMLSSPKSQVQLLDGSYATSKKMKFSGEARE